jgi:hypothetical protein
LLSDEPVSEVLHAACRAYDSGRGAWPSHVRRVNGSRTCRSIRLPIERGGGTRSSDY